MGDHTCRVWLEEAGNDRRRIGDILETMTVPRVGEDVGMNGKYWRVVDVSYLYPRLGSHNHTIGKLGPVVSVGVVEVVDG